ncbi:hypothetical protein J2X92_001297 [Variovorax paradoxus]|nr:hypothetical protein [Variovorax paradoxus]
MYATKSSSSTSGKMMIPKFMLSNSLTGEERLRNNSNSAAEIVRARNGRHRCVIAGF